MDNSYNSPSRKFERFPIKDNGVFKQQMLNWAQKFNICCLLDNHSYKSPYHTVDCLLAVGAVNTFEVTTDFFSNLSNFYRENDDWIFGHFSYDLKNQIENLSSNNADNIHFPDTFLFVPEIVLHLKDDEVWIGSLDSRQLFIYQQILHHPVLKVTSIEVEIQSRLSKAEYFSAIKSLKDHIKKGDCYEINYCQEFFCEQAEVEPLAVYQKLTEVSPNPFCAFYKIYDKYLLCASPERYLKKQGNKLISQPIKGTIKRDFDDENIDGSNKKKLFESEKERAENVMVVDLVRNDLSRICKKGSVQVEDLFQIYSFPQVHQMVSTVAGELEDGVGITEILQATFPMGSMTGAPKKKVMELIEDYETTRRGIFSGAVGYITPSKDFDFNVVIRSLMYNSSKRYLSYQVGSAITFNSDPELEYEECLLKAAAIKKVLG